jgi:Fis family transcriptional regulator, factor for inversion stimulation protein
MKTPKLNGTHAIAAAVQHSLDEYFIVLDGEPAHNLHEMMIGSVEKALLADVMKRTADNQTQASEMLGITRSTLRAKLEKYKLR